MRVRTRTKVPGLSGRTIRCYGVPPVAIHITFEELLLRVRRDDAPYQCKKIVVKSARGVCSLLRQPLLGDYVYANEEEINYVLDIMQGSFQHFYMSFVFTDSLLTIII